MRGGFLNKREQVEFTTRKYKDCVVQTRVSGITLANAIIWLENTYGQVYNMSQALRGALEILEKTAIDEGLEVITDPEQAEEFLGELGVQLRTNRRGGYSHMRSLQQDVIKREKQLTQRFNDGLPETKPEFKKQFVLGLQGAGISMSEEELEKKVEMGWATLCSQRKVPVLGTTVSANASSTNELTDSERNDLKAGKVLDPTEFNWNDADKVLNELSKPQVVVTKKEENSNG